MKTVGDKLEAFAVTGVNPGKHYKNFSWVIFEDGIMIQG